MIARPDLYTVPGGDTVQIKETAHALKNYNVEAEIVLDKNPDYNKYDLLHFFNIIDPEDILGHVYNCHKPFVVSTIYVDYREYDKHQRGGMIGKLSKILPGNTIEYGKTAAKYLLKGEKVSTNRFFLKGHKASIKFILSKAAMLLPNSENEYKRLLNDYGISCRYTVVPNAINADLFRPDLTSDRNLVLCVARLEGRKNQLNVIRALNNTHYKVVFIGAASPNQKAYVDQCKKEAGPNIQFIDQISQAELLNFYNRAKVHVLASWFETTGLSNLEAAAMGCNLVLGNRGDVKDYFGKHAHYCEPGNINSIKEAVDKAYNSEYNASLWEIIFNNFTWKHTASKTFEAYKQVLGL